MVNLARYFGQFSWLGAMKEPLSLHISGYEWTAFGFIGYVSFGKSVLLIANIYYYKLCNGGQIPSAGRVGVAG